MNVLIGPDTKIVYSRSHWCCLKEKQNGLTTVSQQNLLRCVKLCCADVQSQGNVSGSGTKSVSFLRGDWCDFRVSWTRTLKL